MKTKTVPKSIRISAEDEKMLKELARKMDRSESGVVRYLIRKAHEELNKGENNE